MVSAQPRIEKAAICKNARPAVSARPTLKTGRLGCPLCYDTFSEGLNSLLKAMHKGTTHTGKTPARLQEILRHDAEMQSLQKNLEKAVVEEDYESAAEIRDQIKHLENKSEINQ